MGKKVLSAKSNTLSDGRLVLSSKQKKPKEVDHDKDEVVDGEDKKPGSELGKNLGKLVTKGR